MEDVVTSPLEVQQRNVHRPSHDTGCVAFLAAIFFVCFAPYYTLHMLTIVDYFNNIPSTVMYLYGVFYVLNLIKTIIFPVGYLWLCSGVYSAVKQACPCFCKPPRGSNSYEMGNAEHV